MLDWKANYEAFKKKHPSQPSESPSASEGSSGRESKPRQLVACLEDNLQSFQNQMSNVTDLVVRRLKIMGKRSSALLFLTSLTDQRLIQEGIVAPLQAPFVSPEQMKDEDLLDRVDLFNLVCQERVHANLGQRSSEWSVLMDLLMKGQTLLLIDGYGEGVSFDTRKVEKRGIEQPQTEQVIRGSRDGFIEQLETNLSLIRYRLQTADLVIETGELGARTKSKTAVCYIDGIANPELVSEVMRRLSIIDIDGIIDAGYIEQFIEDQPISPFPQIQNTERADKTVASLLEGRVAILVDGSSFALIVPALFDQFFQTIDDYSERFLIASLLRFVRLIALLFSVFFPSLYVSVISYNPELMPTDFAVAIAGGRAGVPFPAMLEVLIMEASMEILREATIRLPQMIGGALSIVGVLVIGQAAVSAGLSSPITVVIVALTTIGSFATPAYNAAIAMRMLRFPLIIMAGLFGLYGVVLGSLFIINHMLYLDSFGVPFLQSILAKKRAGFMDTLIRAPLWWMGKRPSYLHTLDDTRRAEGTFYANVDKIYYQEDNADAENTEN
ncbi:MAG: spore germination protein [Paenibacillus sp.]|uniref:spore germination protein n=1 Tax=Paenibacillus sp. TaxID=58172 RepID=UPI00291145C1|nr:spore germination protein [Paenibacillus sp.]MDU4695860.1 spore germination protein [Paenibacillus sp.]